VCLWVRKKENEKERRKEEEMIVEDFSSPQRKRFVVVPIGFQLDSNSNWIPIGFRSQTIA
jgi:hypothetical protein